MPGTIVIEGAVDSELQVLIDTLKPTKEVTLGGIWRAFVCDCESGRIAIVNTHVGVANAAAATALAGAFLKPTAVISQGTAGAHDISLHTGDVVIGSRIVRLGAYRSPVRRSGIMPLSWQPLDEEGSIGNGIPTVYTSDTALSEAAKSALKRCGFGEKEHMRILMGTIGSGDVWNCEHDMIEYLHSTYGTSCEEMETYSAASVCAHMNIPFLSLRIISNNERIGERYAPDVAAKLQHVVGDCAKMLLEQMT